MVNYGGCKAFFCVFNFFLTWHIFLKELTMEIGGAQLLLFLSGHRYALTSLSNWRSVWPVAITAAAVFGALAGNYVSLHFMHAENEP